MVSCLHAPGGVSEVGWVRQKSGCFARYRHSLWIVTGIVRYIRGRQIIPAESRPPVTITTMLRAERWPIVCVMICVSAVWLRCRLGTHPFSIVNTHTSLIPCLAAPLPKNKADWIATHVHTPGHAPWAKQELSETHLHHRRAIPSKLPPSSPAMPMVADRRQAQNDTTQSLQWRHRLNWRH